MEKKKKKRKTNLDKELMRQIMDDVILFGTGGYRQDSKGNKTKLTIEELFKIDYGKSKKRSNEE